MVKYTYTAYGEVTKQIIKQRNVSTYNSFLYKGYYYDVETELYWVSSRYYSPELCRWILPDSIEYLDSESINGLNLYCYCMYNPNLYVVNQPINVIAGQYGGGTQYVLQETIRQLLESGAISPL